MKIHALRIGSIAGLAMASTVPLLAQSAFDMRVTGAWIGWLPTNLRCAGYMTLTNKGSMSQPLIGVRSAYCGEMALHQTRRLEGMTGRALIDAIELRPAMSINFERDGYHLMLMEPRRSIRPGDEIAMTLRFSNGQSMSVTFAVRAGDAVAKGMR